MMWMRFGLPDEADQSTSARMPQHRVTKIMLRHGDVIVAVATASMLVLAIVFFSASEWFLGSYLVGVAVIGGWMTLFHTG